MAIKKLKKLQNPKMKPGPIHRLKNKKSHELRLIRPKTSHKTPEHTYLKFLTPSLEKIRNLH